MLKEIGAPVQVPKVGVTVIVPLMADVVGLVVVKLGKSPVPEAPRPIFVFELVQLKTTPGVVLVKLTALTVVL